MADSPEQTQAAALKRPFFITIDNEGDDLWSRPSEIDVQNAKYLRRFQTLCEKFDFKPVYLTNYEMARAPEFVELGRDVLARGCGEIGMHLHAWNSPPLVPLTGNDFVHQPYLIEYSDEVMRQKILEMTRLLEDMFDVRPVSHRAGRWALDGRYASLLVELGYTIDCSVTPGIDWRESKGDPRREGGADYSAFPAEPYFMDLANIAKSGASPLLEVPMSIVPRATLGKPTGLRGLAERLGIRRAAQPVWLRPNGHNLNEMLQLVRHVEKSDAQHLEFMLHSSEFMPRGSPTFPDERSIEAMYADLEILFAEIDRAFVGTTLCDYYGQVRTSRDATLNHDELRPAMQTTCAY